MKNKGIYQYFIELVIVIVGVTIAFWLNTRAESIKENKTLKNYYAELRSDLEQDRKTISLIITANEKKQQDMVSAMRLYQEEPVNGDSIFYYSQMVGNYYFFDPKDITYNSMINSGDLKLINDPELKRLLVSLYDKYQTIDYLQQNHLQALDENYFPRYVLMVDYITGEVLQPLEEDILIKNYFAFSANELGTHVEFYKSALKVNQTLDSLILKNF